MPQSQPESGLRALAAIRSLKPNIPLAAYRGEWVALQGDRVADHDRDIQRLLARLGEDLEDYVFDSVPEDDILVLAV